MPQTSFWVLHSLFPCSRNTAGYTCRCRRLVFLLTRSLNSNFAADSQHAGDSNPPGSDTTTPHSSATFRSFVETQIQLVDEDDQDNELLSTEGSNGPVELTRLFNFDESYWCDLYARIAKPSYDEELALYELLELDADGENDIELDGTTVIVIVMVIK